MPRLDQLHKLLAADPSDADVPYMIAQEHARAGEHAMAVEWYDRCLALNPHYHYAYFHKARAQEAADDIPAAIATLREGLTRAKSKQDAKAMNEIGGYLDMLGG